MKEYQSIKTKVVKFEYLEATYKLLAKYLKANRDIVKVEIEATKNDIEVILWRGPLPILFVLLEGGNGGYALACNYDTIIATTRI